MLADSDIVAKYILLGLLIGWAVTFPFLLAFTVYLRVGWKDFLLIVALSPISWPTLWLVLLILWWGRRERIRRMREL